MHRTTILATISGLLTLLFVYASFTKLLQFGLFRYQLHNQIFPDWAVPILAWTIPAVELFIVAALFLSRTRSVGLWASLLLLTLFTGYIILILLHVFPRVPCSCGGVIQSLGWSGHLLFNLFFTAIALAGVLLSRHGANSHPFRSNLPIA